MFANKFGKYSHCECGLVITKKEDDKEARVPVPLTSSKVDFTIFDAFAEVSVTQVYANQETSPIEAEYIFPLDDKAAVFEFEAEIEGRRVVGKIKEKEQARQEYQDAIEHGQTAAMLEKKKPDIFKASIGCLKPGAKAVVKISYISELSVDSDFLRFVLPTTVAPRYVPPTDKNLTAQELNSMPYSAFSPCQMLVKGRVVAKTKIVELTSPSHNIDTNLNPEDASKLPAGNHSTTVNLSGVSTDMDRDFILLVKVEDPHQPRVFVEENGDSITAMVTLVPSFKLPEEKIEIIFLIDRSGSMEGEKVKMAKNALKLFLKSLPSDCYFNVVGFGSKFVALFGNGSVKYGGESLSKAMEYADKLDADMGGTEILEPMKHVYEMAKIDGYKRQVIAVTDGEVSNSEQVLELVKTHNKESRTFTLGIGSDVSHGLVRGIARMGHGTSLFCSLDERLETKVQLQLANCLQPALQDVGIKWGSLLTAINKRSGDSRGDSNVEESRTLLGFGKQKKVDAEEGSISEPVAGQDEDPSVVLAPYHIPPIFDGAKFTQFCTFPKALLSAGGASGLETILGPVVIKATAPDGPLEVKLDINSTDVLEGSTIHRLAMKIRIQDLEEGVSELHKNVAEDSFVSYQEQEAFNNRIKNALVNVSTKYNIICRETAFIAVDVDAKREEAGEIVMKKRSVANQVPYGYGRFGIVGGFCDMDDNLHQVSGMLSNLRDMALAMNVELDCQTTQIACISAGDLDQQPGLAIERCQRLLGGWTKKAAPAGGTEELDDAYSDFAMERQVDFCQSEDLAGIDQRLEEEEYDHPEIYGKAEGTKELDPSEWDQEEKLRGLVELQEFDGCFPLKLDLAKLLCTTLDDLVQAARDLKLDGRVWATALAICFMQTVLDELEDDWQRMCTKAKKWLSEQFARKEGAPLDLDGAIAAAADHVKKLLHT